MTVWVQQILLEWSTKTLRQPFLNFYSLIFSFSHPPTHPPTASHLTLLSHASVNAFVEVLKASMLLYLMGPLWPDFSPVFTTVYITFPERTVAFGFHGKTLFLFIINSPNVHFAFTASCSWALKYHPVPKHHLSTFLLYLNSSSNLLTHSFSWHLDANHF